MELSSFKETYYSKEELVAYCKANDLQATGSKIELTERIYHFLLNGEKQTSNIKRAKASFEATPTLDSLIGEDFVCSEIKRAFFKEHIGKSFSFNVRFQNWLKANSDKTYQDAINAYKVIKSTKNDKIDSQFEYNTYIRDFFKDNEGYSLEDCIRCWMFKKKVAGNHKYEKSDLSVLNQNKKTN